MLIVVSLKNLANSNKIMPQVVNKCYYIYVIDILIGTPMFCQYYGFVLFLVLTYSGPLLSVGDIFRDLQWMPETTNGTKLSPFPLKGSTLYSISLANPNC